MHKSKTKNNKNSKIKTSNLQNKTKCLSREYKKYIKVKIVQNTNSQFKLNLIRRKEIAFSINYPWLICLGCLSSQFMNLLSKIIGNFALINKYKSIKHWEIKNFLNTAISFLLRSKPKSIWSQRWINRKWILKDFLIKNLQLIGKFK